MTNTAEDYKTDFGEFIDFTTESTDQTPVIEQFTDFRKIDEIPLEKSPLYSQIGEIAARFKKDKNPK